MKMLKKIVRMTVAVLLIPVCDCLGQDFAVSTNLSGYAAMGTMNAELSYGVRQHWTLEAGARYNPFTFAKGENRKQLMMRSAAIGARWWPWHVFSGWWLWPKVQWEEYNVGGWGSTRTVEGDMVGAGLGGGYTYMLNSNLNFELGLSFWGGRRTYTVYSCPHCGIRQDAGSKTFLLPDDVIISLSYVF